MAIVFLIVGLLTMGISLIFYRRGVVYWGFLVPPYLRKADRVGDPEIFWFWIVTIFTISLALLLMGFYMLVTQSA